MGMRLGSLAEAITVGQIMSRVSYKEGEDMTGAMTVSVLVPSAISGGVVVHSNLGSANLKKDVDESRITRAGDIVIKLSSPYDCALVTEYDEGFVIPSFCAIVRGVNTELADPRYVVGYINSQYAQAKLVAGINSTAMAMVRQKSLADLEILLPGLDQQEIIGEAYWASCLRRAKLLEIAEHQQRIGEAIIVESIREVTGHAEE